LLREARERGEGHGETEEQRAEEQGTYVKGIDIGPL